MKRIFTLILVVTMAFAMVACGAPATPAASNGSSSSAPTAVSSSAAAVSSPAAASAPMSGEDFDKKGYKIAYIINQSPTDIFKMAVEGAQETGKKLGIQVDYYFTNMDNLIFQDTVNTCAQQGYNAMLLSHGNQESALDLVTNLDKKGIKVVCFDTQFLDKSGAKTQIPGVTQMFQADQKMADLLLDYICNKLFPDKVAKKEKIKVLKLWRGPGVAPFDRRQETYKKYEDNGLIETLEVLAPTDPKNSEATMTTVVAAALAKYPKGSVDVIWSAYDAYARGAYIAMKEANRTDIPLVTVDISNQDINFMLEPINVWKACAAVHFATVGEQGIRLCAMKLHGDQTEDVYNLTPSFVTYDKLTKESNVLNLGKTVEGYGVNNDHITDWMKPYFSK